MFKPGVAMCSKNDEVNIFIGCEGNDFINGVAFLAVGNQFNPVMLVGFEKICKRFACSKEHGFNVGKCSRWIDESHFGDEY